MGYTLRQALDMLGPQAKVVVGELLGDVVEWNRAFFGDLNGHPLGDGRVDVQTSDIVELISRSKSRFDAILLDIDNGPDAMTDSGNRRLYKREGLQACRRALREQGCLAVWSAEVAAEDKTILPPGGGEPRLPPKKPSRGGRRQFRKRH
jgi:spermidine synthase